MSEPAVTLRPAKPGWSATPPQATGLPVVRPLPGIAFMCLAGTIFPLMNGLAKLMSESYSSEQVVWARTLSHLLLVLAVLMPRYGVALLATRRPTVQLARSCMLLTSTFLFFSALKFISVAQAASISFVAPLIVVLLAGPVLGEKVSLGRVIAVLFGFFGVLVVIRPGSSVFQWASLLVLGSAACYAVYQLLTRLVAGVDKPETSVVYSALVGSVILSFVVPWFWKTPERWMDVLLLCSLGALGATGHYCVARALTYAPANFVSPFHYWQMVGSVAVGYLLFGDLPDEFTWIGTALIIGAGLYVGLRGGKIASVALRGASGGPRQPSG